jgi:hypothetical protein
LDNVKYEVWVRNSILSGPGDNCSDWIKDLGNNLDSGNTCGLNTDLGSLINSDPALGPLGDNGSNKTTRTHALLLNSAAINQGDPSYCPNDDQRGLPRRLGYCDIGAYEAQLASLVALSGSGQSTTILTEFSNPLTVGLEDQYSSRLGGVQVTLNGPETGAGISNSGAILTSGPSGLLQFTAIANGIPGGPYIVTAMSGGKNANFSLTNLPPVISATLYLPLILFTPLPPY